MDVWVARQPIFDRNQNLYAYELLFRSDRNGAAFDGKDAAAATTQVIANTMLGIGIEKLLAGHKAFINFDRSLLLGNLFSMLPRENTVVEVLETVEADDEVLDACRKLRAQGYTVALDDFERRPETEPLTQFAQIIKVDVKMTSRAEQERMLRNYKPRGIRMLAEKVETREEFEWAFQAGYDYFQGYFFARPNVVSGTRISPVTAVCLNLLREMQRIDLNFGRIETLIASDVGLTFQLLSYVGSAALYRSAPVSSIRHALVLLGENKVRQWASLATLSRLAKDKPDELLVLSLVRAHFSEYLLNLAKTTPAETISPQDAFLMGLFSLIDALLDLPLREALRRADVDHRIGAALLGTAPDGDVLHVIHRLVRAWESGNWQAVSELARRAGIPVSSIGEAYSESALWAEQASQGKASRNYSRHSPRRAHSGVLQLNWRDQSGKKRTLKGSVVDISTGGLGLRAAETVPPHSTVVCDAPELGIRGKGFVRYCERSHSDYLIGVECSEIAGWVGQA